MKLTSCRSTHSTHLVILLSSVIISPLSAAIVYTNDFTSEFDANSRDAHILGGAAPTITFNGFFGPLDNNGVGIDAGTLNFLNNVNDRGAGVWLDSSSWGAGTVVEVSFDISSFSPKASGTESFFQAYEGYNVDGSSSISMDVHNGSNRPETSATGSASVGTIGDRGSITGDGTLTFNFVHNGAAATAFVFYNNGGSLGSNTFTLDNLTVSIPEPTSSILLGLGALGLVFRRARKQG